jgi:hypothetical protein
MYSFEVTSSGITYIRRYVKICQLVRKLEGGAQTRGQRIVLIGPRLSLSEGSGLKGGFTAQPHSRIAASNFIMILL